MYIHTEFFERVIDFSHFDELEIRYVDEEDCFCEDFEKAVKFAVYANKYVQKSENRHFAVGLCDSSDFQDCITVIKDLTYHLRKATPVVTITFNNAEREDYSPVVREFK